MKNSEKPAFGIPAFTDTTGREQYLTHEKNDGMTLREYYAGLAMQGLLANSAQIIDQYLVTQAIFYANELLEQLETPKL